MQKKSKKIIRITTVAASLNGLLKGQLRYMSQYYEIIGVAANKEGLIKVEMQEGIRTHEVHMTRKITPIKDLIALFKLYFFFKRERPDMVHTHTPKAGL